MDETLPIIEKIAAIDQNVRELWDVFDEANQKRLKGEFFILNRWVSSVRGSLEQQQHYLLLTNEYYNKNYYLLQKHPKLLWLLLCMCSYNGEKVFFHEWIGKGKSVTDPLGKIKILTELYPDLNDAELNVMANTVTNEQLVEYANEFGIDVTAFASKAKIKIQSDKPKKSRKTK